MEIKNFRAVHDKDYIFELIEEGEHEQQDFKFAISDSRKIARSIAAFANNRGGRLLVGVKDNGNIAGIRSEEEFYMIEQAAEMYCKPAQRVEQTVYCIEGKYVLKVDIAPSKARPVYAQDDSRNWQIYYRVADENIQTPEFFARIWRAQRRRGEMVAFSDMESRLLAFVAEKETATPDEIAKAVHASKVAVEDTIVRLCSMQLLRPVHTSGAWQFECETLE